MAHLILGEHPDGLTVRLVRGDGMNLAATLTDGAGVETDWPDAPSLEFGSSEHDVIATHAATIDGPAASWQLTSAQVDAIWDGSLNRYGSPITYVRAVLPDGDDGSVEYAGRVAWSDGWTAGTQAQTKTFTQPGVPGPAGPQGPPGSGGGSDSLTIVNGGTVALDDTKAEGSLVGYRVKSSTEFTAETGTVTLAPGVHTWERTSTGWTYYTSPAGSMLGATPPVDPGITDTFTGANGTLAGHTPDTGTASSWSDGSGMGYMPPATPAPPIVNNKVSMAGNISYGAKLPVPHGSSTVASFDYAVTPGAQDSNVMLAFGDVDNYIYVSVRQSGDVIAYHAPSFTEYANVSGQPATGRLEFSYIGNAITLSINGTTIATGTRTMTLVAPHIAIGSHGSANVATIDNLEVAAS